MNDTPALSVIVLTSDRPDLLRRTLASVRKQLSRRDEIVIVDGSVHTAVKTRDTVKSFVPSCSVSLIKNLRGTIACGRMLGAGHAKHPFVVYLDDDCAAEDGYLSRFRRHFRSDRRLSAVMGRITNAYPMHPVASAQFAYYDRGLRQHFSKRTGSEIVSDGRILDAEVMGIRKDTLLKLGIPERDRWYRNDDVELGIRLVRLGFRIIFDPGITASSVPRTSSGRFIQAAFWNGYSDVCTERVLGADLKHPPFPSRFPAWFFETLRTTAISGWHRAVFAIFLILFPVTGRMGRWWYIVRHL